MSLKNLVKKDAISVEERNLKIIFKILKGILILIFRDYSRTFFFNLSKKTKKNYESILHLPRG